MKVSKQLLTMAFLLTTISIFGQTKSEKLEELPYIEVTGTAEKEIIPDEIYINIVIREKYVSKVKVTIEEQEEKLKNAVKSIGVDLTNLYLSDVYADYVTVRWHKKDVFTKKDYTLKVSDAATVGKVFQELEKLEIKEAFISKVNHSKIEIFKREVKIMAIKSAKDKADYLLTAIGESTGKPLVIKETELTQHLQHLPGVTFKRYHNAGEIKDEEDIIQYQKMKIQSNIYAKFSIK